MEHEFAQDLILFDEDDKTYFNIKIDYDVTFEVDPSFAGNPDSWTEGTPAEIEWNTIEIEFAEGVWLTVQPGDFEYFAKQFDTEKLFEEYGDWLENCHCSGVDY